VLAFAWIIVCLYLQAPGSHQRKAKAGSLLSLGSIMKYTKYNKTAYRALLNNVETAQVFEKGSVKVWECRNCGHLVVGTKAPEVCPVCSHPQSYFEVREENY
jgi:rubrerythrin